MAFSPRVPMYKNSETVTGSIPSPVVFLVQSIGIVFILMFLNL